MLRAEEKRRQLSAPSSKVGVTIFTPEPNGEDELGPHGLTQNYPVSRSELDFRNSMQLPWVRFADAPPPAHFPM